MLSSKLIWWCCKPESLVKISSAGLKGKIKELKYIPFSSVITNSTQLSREQNNSSFPQCFCQFGCTFLLHLYFSHVPATAPGSSTTFLDDLSSNFAFLPSTSLFLTAFPKHFPFERCLVEANLSIHPRSATTVLKAAENGLPPSKVQFPF